MPSLRFKRVLITGAARGLGFALARRFAAQGAEVVLTDLDGERLEEASATIAQEGGRCLAFRLDITDERAISGVREAMHCEAGTLDILVNNAGVVFGGPFLEVPLAKHRATFRVNIEGMVTMTHAFLSDLIASPRGHLVTIASASGFVGLPNGATYAASKWAAIGFAESIRAELKHLGHRHVDSTIVCPTYIATGMFEGAKPPKTAHFLDPDELASKIADAVAERQLWVLEPWIVKATPFLKNCLPQGVADLLSDAFGASTSMDEWRGHSSSAAGQTTHEPTDPRS